MVEVQPASAAVSEYEVLIDGVHHASYVTNGDGGFILETAPVVNGIGFSDSFNSGESCTLENIYAPGEICHSI